MLLRAAEPFFPKAGRRRAIDKAVAFVTQRLNGEDGLGAIYPAMANSVMMFDTLGYAPDHPDAAIAWQSVRNLLVMQQDRAYCQPCLSPVWDTESGWTRPRRGRGFDRCRLCLAAAFADFGRRR